MTTFKMLRELWSQETLQPLFVLVVGAVASTLGTTYDTSGETITASTVNLLTISITPGDQALLPDIAFLLLIGLLIFNIGALVALFFISITGHLRAML